MNKLLLIAILVFSNVNVKANNISIQKVSLLDTNRAAKTVAIRINISWENSWRDSINWDAAWIFFKFKEPKDSIWRWRHGTLSKNGNFPGISNAAMKIVVPDDLKGFFLYRQGIGNGNIRTDSIRLLWNYGADGVTNIDSVEVRMFATEMVYVPEGSFAIGDGNGRQRSSFSFQLKNAPNNYVVITNKWSPLINTFMGNNTFGYDDIALYRDGIRISGLDGLDIDGDRNAEFKDFPTGYRSFYVMKYEVTQGQYTDFLNTLSLRDTTGFSLPLNDTLKNKKVNSKLKQALQNLDPFFTFTPIETYRHTISLDTNEVRYRVNRPDRAFGQANWWHWLSFSDWSCLRPMSELEFEKACRGPLPPHFWTPNSIPNSSPDVLIKWFGAEWSWGVDTFYTRRATFQPLQFSGLENGTEFFSNYSIFRRYDDPTLGATGGPGNGGTAGGDGGTGPFRVGIYANDTTSRLTSGASYYGIMDLSKNVSEYTISLGNPPTPTGNINSRNFSYKIHGDGILNALGQSNDYVFTGTSQQRHQAISARGNYSGGNGLSGFRAVRAAPSDN